MKYIGMDAHSGTSTFVVLGESGRVLRQETVPTEEDKLLCFIRSITGKKALAFEEGPLAQWLYILYRDEVDECVVCQPPGKQGPKTDPIDAKEIADLLRVGRLKSVFHADDDLMNLRVLVSGYEDLVQELVRAKNRYKAVYRRLNVPTDAEDFYTSREHLKTLSYGTHFYVACTLLEQIEKLEEQKRGYHERFDSNARHYRPIKLLMSIPGLGAVRANELVAVIVDPRRFADKYHFCSYSMLVKHERTSDGKSYGSSRPRGQKLLKSIFKSAALSAIKSDNSFKRKHDAMLRSGKPEYAARNAVSRKLAGVVLGTWKSGTKYNDNFKEVTLRQSQKVAIAESENL